MKIQKFYRGGESKHWHDISEDDVIAQTEVQGWYDKGTVITMLSRGEEIRTPYAVFRNAEIKQRRHLPNGFKTNAWRS